MSKPLTFAELDAARARRDDRQRIAFELTQSIDRYQQVQQHEHERCLERRDTFARGPFAPDPEQASDRRPPPYRPPPL